MSTSNRISACLAYLLLIIGWIYIFLFRREDKLAIYHTKQSIMLTIVAVGISLAWVVFGWFVSLVPFIGFIIAVALFALVMAIYILLAVNWVVGMVYALQARFKPIPVVGGWAEQLPIG